MLLCAVCGSRPPLCAACVERSRSWLRGAAAARGYWWATRVRSQGTRGRWPAWAASDRLRAQARALVADLARGDEHLGELLARACADAARAEWQAPAPRPGAVAFYVGQGR